MFDSLSHFLISDAEHLIYFPEIAKNRGRIFFFLVITWEAKVRFGLMLQGIRSCQIMCETNVKMNKKRHLIKYYLELNWQCEGIELRRSPGKSTRLQNILETDDKKEGKNDRYRYRSAKYIVPLSKLPIGLDKLVLAVKVGSKLMLRQK